jgi:hypothetical protein
MSKKVIEIVLSEHQCSQLVAIAESKGNSIETDEECSLLAEQLLDEAIELNYDIILANEKTQN